MTTWTVDVRPDYQQPTFNGTPIADMPHTSGKALAVVLRTRAARIREGDES